ncbi:nucleotidyltransferase domain-containing protein [Nocardia salmonicida]|uniref:nucleotidyltransferase domain-containing protein n=1 Tax=Nocardia salmonicida TaxID=53431 RepID=UPI003CE883DC
MSVATAFAAFQQTVNADIEDVREARARRDLLKKAFLPEADILEVVPSGSLARGTYKDPIHDVDVILIFDPTKHPGWGDPGQSAADSLDYTRCKVNTLLGATNGTVEKAVRLARWRNHAVKCFIDAPNDPAEFTVDAMPAFRRDGMLFIPEAISENWVYSHPEYLIAATAAKHAEWNKFAGTVRMLKRWADDQNIEIKSLVMEVLALQHLPLGLTQSAAVKQFFVAASYHIEGGTEVTDPADICGPIQSDLDYSKFADRLAVARADAVAATQAQGNNDTYSAILHWGAVFGSDFPAPTTSDGSPLPATAPLGPRPVKDTPQG